MQEPYDIQAIMKLMPHRYPFLLIDRVIKLVAGEQIVAIKNVTINEPFFQGHFPGNPIMPGVLIIEAMAQAGGILAYESMPPDSRSRLVYFMGMDKVKFRKPVLPGDQLVLEAETLRVKARTGHVRCRATVDGQMVSQAEIKFMLVDAEPV